MFLVGSEGNVRHWGPLPAGAFRPSGPWCFAVSQPPARTSLWSCFEGMGAALWSWFLVGSEGNVRHQLQQHHQQQQQQAQQLNSLCFYQNPEGTSSPGTACFWRSFRPSGPWCFAVSQPPARTLLWSCFEGMGAALWSWFLVGSEGNVRHWRALPAGAFHPSGPWCCAVSQPPARSLLWSRCPQARSVLQGHGVSCFATARWDFVVEHFEGMGAALWSWFLVGSEGNVRCPQARSVLQGHGVLLFRNRPLGLCCGAALRAWELHFGAGFLSVQKATLGTSSSSLTSSSSRSSSSSRPSSCNFFVLNRSQKGRQASGQHVFWR